MSTDDVPKIIKLVNVY